MLKVLLEGHRIYFTRGSFYIWEEINVDALKPGKTFRIYEVSLDGEKFIGEFVAEKIDNNTIKIWQFTFKQLEDGIMVEFDGETAFYETDTNEFPIKSDDAKKFQALLQQKGKYEKVMYKDGILLLDKMVNKIDNEPVYTWYVKDNTLVVNVDGCKFEVIEVNDKVKIENVVYTFYSRPQITFSTPAGKFTINIEKNYYTVYLPKINKELVFAKSNSENAFMVFYSKILDSGNPYNAYTTVKYFLSGSFFERKFMIQNGGDQAC